MGVLTLVRHQQVQRFVAGAGLVDAGQQLGDLRHGGNRSAGQNCAGDDGAKAELAIANQQSADGNHADLNKLLRHVGHVGCQLRQHAGFKTNVRLVRHRILPAPAHQRACAQRFDGFQAVERFDQNGMLVVAVFLRLFDQTAQLGLYRQARQQHHRNGQKRHPKQRPANEPNHEQKQDGKRDVDEGRQSGRGQEVTDRLELLHHAGHSATAAPARLQLGVQHVFKQAVGNGRIGLGAGQVQKVAAQRANGKVTHKNDRYADQQSHQSIGGVVGDDSVVDNHRKDRACQCKHIDQQRSQTHLDIDPTCP